MPPPRRAGHPASHSLDKVALANDELANDVNELQHEFMRVKTALKTGNCTLRANAEGQVADLADKAATASRRYESLQRRMNDLKTNPTTVQFGGASFRRLIRLSELLGGDINVLQQATAKLHSEHADHEPVESIPEPVVNIKNTVVDIQNKRIHPPAAERTPAKPAAPMNPFLERPAVSFSGVNPFEKNPVALNPKDNLLFKKDPVLKNPFEKTTFPEPATSAAAEEELEPENSEPMPECRLATQETQETQMPAVVHDKETIPNPVNPNTTPEIVDPTPLHIHAPTGETHGEVLVEQTACLRKKDGKLALSVDGTVGVSAKDGLLSRLLLLSPELGAGMSVEERTDDLRVEDPATPKDERVCEEEQVPCVPRMDTPVFEPELQCKEGGNSTYGPQMMLGSSTPGDESTTAAVVVRHRDGERMETGDLLSGGGLFETPEIPVKHDNE
jgi:hypothetical protein